VSDVTAADPAAEAGFAPSNRAPAPRARERWPGRRPLVWAPRAHTVDVVLPQPYGPALRRPLRLVGAHEPGYWRADEDLPYGTDYAFSIDDGPPLPDPCATLLPHGLHGPSRVLDDRFTWTDSSWPGARLSRATLLHLDIAGLTREGNLDAAARLRPAVAALGVDGVELSPLSAFDPERGPEGGVRLFAVHEPYGGPGALQRFVDAAHVHGLAVVLDLPHRWAVADYLGLHAFGPYATGSRIGAPSGSGSRSDAPRINLDGSGSRGPRDFLVADAERWMTVFHLDGMLLDIDALVDRSSAPFLGELADAVQKVGEATGIPRTMLTDGRGLSDRLTTLVGLLLEGRAVNPIGLVRRLADDLDPVGAPPRSAPATLRRAYRATQRSAPVLVGDLTRLPAAARAVPWSDDVEEGTPHPAVDDRAVMLACALLAGTPVVLDTEHVPVGGTGPDARRLVAWARTLLALRPTVLSAFGSAVEVSHAAGALVVRRGDSVLLLRLDHSPGEIPLAAHLGTTAGDWRVVAAWHHDTTRMVDGTLHVPGRSAVVLQTAEPLRIP
jgi:maltooligosyltrehalose trehalohydrolase